MSNIARTLHDFFFFLLFKAELKAKKHFVLIRFLARETHLNSDKVRNFFLSKPHLKQKLFQL